MLPKLKQRLKRLWKRGKPQAGPSPEQHDRAALPTRPPDVQESSIIVLESPTTSPAPTFVQPTAPDLEVTQPSLPKRLWNEAYDSLKGEQPELVDAYERILSRELRGDLSPADKAFNKNEIDQTNPETRRIQFDQILQSGLKKTAKEAAVKQNIQEAMDVIDSVKGWIDAAVKSAPEAAIAWTGVCFALEILASPIDEAVANRDGITYVTSRMNWYWNLAYFLDEDQGDKSSGLRGHLEHQIIDLYKNLLSYQINSICLYYRNRFLAFLRDIVKLDDWENTLQSIKDLESSIQRDFDTFTNSEINDRLQRLAATADSMHSDIYQAIQHQTATQEETQQKEKNDECLAALRVTDPYDDKTRISFTKGGLHRESSNWILEHADFRRWYDNEKARVLWVKGDPGKGKTMLLIAIVDELEKRACPKSSPSTVLSYFFCQGTNSSLNNASAVLRGLIYRLGYQKQSLISHLREKYDKSGRNLFNDENTFFALSKILEDILHDADLSRAYIVIDALDECEKELEQLLGFIVRNTALTRVKWVISSRNRHDIEQQLKLNDSGAKLSLELTQNAEQVSHAVNAYIDFKLHKVPSLQGNNDLKIRVGNVMRQKAAGTFLWVALVAQQLEMIDSWDVLSVIEELPPGLDEIYGRMMVQINQYKRQNPQFCRQVLSAAILVYRPLRLTEMAVLSGLPQNISNDLGSVNKLVAMCGSFLTVRDGYVYLIHQSAKDYLSKAGDLGSVGLINIHHDIFSRSLQVMSTLRQNIYNLKSPGLLTSQIEVPDPDPLAAMRYSCIYWVDHFRDFNSNFRGQSRSKGNDMVNKFLREKAIYWLEAMSLTQHLDDAVFAIEKLEGFLQEQSSNPELLEIVRDLHRFMLQNAWVIRTAPLQTYASALIFSPTDCLMRKIFRNEEPKWVTIKPRVQSSWSPFLQTFEAHRDCITSVAFSHDSKLLASCSDDGTIKIWHVASGSLKHTLDSQEGFPTSVVFSHDSKLLASGLHDNRVGIWHIPTGSFIQMLEDHEYIPSDNDDFSPSVIFSHDSKLLASTSNYSTKIWSMETKSLRQSFESDIGEAKSMLSYDLKFMVVGAHHTIEIWDVEMQSRIKTFDSAHYYGYISLVQLSRDSKILAVGSGKGTIQIWSIETGSLQHTFEGHTGLVTSISFSHDLMRLASGSDDGTTKIWNIETEALQETFKPYAWPHSVSFSHDSKLLAMGSCLGAIDILDTASTFPSNRSLEDEAHSTTVLFIKISHDLTLLASESNNTIKIWDAATGSLRQTLEKKNPEYRQMVFSRDSKYFAVMVHKSITIWDTVTWSIKHELNMDDEFNMTSFDDTGSYLYTETERIELSSGARDSTRIQVSPQTMQYQANGAGYGINDDESWITWNGNNILWLPLEYRPNIPSFIHGFEGHLISSLEPPSNGSTNVIVAFGCTSYRVIIIGLDSSGPLDVQ